MRTQVMHDAPDSSKRLPVTARLGIIALLITVPLVGGLVGYRLVYPPGAVDEAPAQDPLYPFLLIVLMGLGFAGVVAGVGLYAVTLVSNCMLGDLAQPFFERLKRRLFLCKVIIPLPLYLGVGVILGALLSPFAAARGIRVQDTLLVCELAVIILGQFILMWVLLWAPLERRLITRRLTALGFLPADIARGRMIGISDPSKSTLRKLSIAEDDVGVLWITPDALVYIGDTKRFRITRPELLRIEQKADAGNPSALAGVAHIILICLGPDQVEWRVRLHVEGVWTMTAARQEMDRLAEVLRRWADGDRTVASPMPVFPASRAAPVTAVPAT